MRISIAISVLILAAAASLGWHDQQRFTAVRENHAKLAAEAGTLGIALDSLHSAHPVRVTKRQRETRDHREAEARLTTVEFIDYFKEMEVANRKGVPPDAAIMQKLMELMDRLMALDSAQLKILIAEILNAYDLKDESRHDFIAFSIMTLANDHPQTALALFTESADLFKDGARTGKHLISSALAKWASDDPLTALEWVRANGAKFPHLVTDDARRGMIVGAAASDPKLAFNLIAELGLKDDRQAVGDIFRMGTTPEERSAALAAFREYLASIPDEAAREKSAAGALSPLEAV